MSLHLVDGELLTTAELRARLKPMPTPGNWDKPAPIALRCPGCKNHLHLSGCLWECLHCFATFDNDTLAEAYAKANRMERTA